MSLLYDMGNYLRSMGFTQIFYMGDSGGNSRGMQAGADSLTKVYANSATPVYFKHIPEYYNHTSVVQPYIQNELKIPEGIKIGASTARADCTRSWASTPPWRSPSRSPFVISSA